MAKKTTVSLLESKPAESANRKQPAKPAIAKGSVTKGSADKKPASASASQASKRVLAQDEIGSVAGEVWHALSERGDQSLPALKKAIDAPEDLVLAAIGWLAREGKLEFTTSHRSLKVSLR